MLTFGILALALAAALFAVFVLRPNAILWRPVVIWCCWIPGAALGVEYLESDALAGVSVLLKSREQSHRDNELKWATVVSAIPAMLLMREIVRELFSSVVRAGG
jgi:hypothetical protein